jgi:hypothetical protein
VDVAAAEGQLLANAIICIAPGTTRFFLEKPGFHVDHNMPEGL